MTVLKKCIWYLGIILSLAKTSEEMSAHQVDADAEKWSSTISHQVNNHFHKIYEDDTKVFKVKPGKSKNIITRNINGKMYQVNRKRHGLAHGMRQSFLAVDIVNALQGMSLSGHPVFASQKGNDFMTWVQKKFQEDPLFLKKLEMTAAFQRTGRQSEAGFDDYPELYKSYERSDARNFENFAKNYIGQGSLFKNKFEMNIYKESLLHKTASEGKIDSNKFEDLAYLRDLMQLTHVLDLRRVPSFSPDTIKSFASDLLFGKLSKKAEKRFVENLWARTGEYLAVTGDRDSVTHKNNFSNQFFEFSAHPGQLTKALHQARKMSAVKFS